MDNIPEGHSTKLLLPTLIKAELTRYTSFLTTQALDKLSPDGNPLTKLTKTADSNSGCTKTVL